MNLFPIFFNYAGYLKWVKSEGGWSFPILSSFNKLINAYIFAELPVCYSGPPGNNCYYINDPCPEGKVDCSDKYYCSVSTNKCCCTKTSKDVICLVEYIDKNAVFYYNNKGV